MKTLSALLLLAMMPGVCDAQILGNLFGGGRRHRGYDSCPDGNCTPYNRSLPIIPPIEEQKKDIDFTDISKDVVVKNVGGNCVWATAEAMLLAAGYDEAKGLRDQAVKNGWNGAWITQLTKVMDNANIKYKMTQSGDMSIFDYAREQGVPVYVQIAVDRPEDHAVAVVGMDEGHTTVRILDPNQPGKILTWTMEHFKRVWGKRALCPMFRKHKKKEDDKAKPETPIIKPAKDCNCDPAAVKALADRIASLEKPPAKSDPATVENTTNINVLTQNVSKLTELIMNQSKSIDGLAASVSQLDKRVSALENRPTASSPKVLSRIEPVRNP